MGWAVGWDPTWERDIGYGVPAPCDQPDCLVEIDRGLSYVCGGEPYGGDSGCGLYFCYDHRFGSLCDRCVDGLEPWPAKGDTLEWMRWKLQHPSWGRWREENPETVFELQLLVAMMEPIDP